MAKPVGSKCNLDCEYCFYLEKETMWPKSQRFQMTDAVLERFVRTYIGSQPTETVTFAWQGGEPTLRGLGFFEKVVELQQTYAGGKKIENALQTNGTLLDAEWCAFFKKHDFLIGLSIDGPQRLHDTYRVGKNGKGSFKDVMRGLELLKQHEVQWNALTCVHRANVEKPLEVYRFLRGVGAKHIQFIPIVERKPDASDKQRGLIHGSPSQDRQEETSSVVSSWSVGAKAYGAFLVSVFDRWVRHDVGRIFVQMNDVTLSKWLGLSGGLCIFEETCGSALALEHDGSIYSCDHFVYPEYRLGNLMDEDVENLVFSDAQIRFGQDKKDTLPRQCVECPVKSLCNGGCPKHRFIKDKYGNPGLNYLCEGYFDYFQHTAPYMKQMANLIRHGRSTVKIMN